ncbi:MAG TPA: DUF1559 domain-containing protein [Planctomicrobium sp.]|nr:DUF1559 domain-containing protein [Planctomicrobium sp.]
MNENPFANSGDEKIPPPESLAYDKLISRIVGWALSLGIIVVLIALLSPAVRTARPASERSQCKNNLKQITLALHNYHDVWGALPPAYTVDADGKPLHSWRTLILAHTDGKSLYDTIDLTKPWDAPVNEQARKTAVSVYQCPSANIPSNHTSYVAIVGEDFAFAPTRPRPFSEFKDGLSNTVLVMEVTPDETFEWMKPQDGGEQIILDMNPKSKTWHIGVFQVTLGDGSVRALSNSIPQETRRALITVDAGDDVGEF